MSNYRIDKEVDFAMFDEFKIEIYLPEEYIILLRDKLNEINACRVGDYDNVVSITKIRGYWRPLEDANPFTGENNKINEGTECKMELRCKRECVKAAIVVIKENHPYEEPLFNIIPIMNSYFMK